MSTETWGPGSAPPSWTNLIQMASVVERGISNKQLSKMDKRIDHTHTHTNTLQGEQTYLKLVQSSLACPVWSSVPFPTIIVIIAALFASCCSSKPYPASLRPRVHWASISGPESDEQLRIASLKLF